MADETNRGSGRRPRRKSAPVKRQHPTDEVEANAAPAGSELAGTPDAPTPDAIDPDAQELAASSDTSDGATDKADPDDVVIDDAELLDDATEQAAEADDEAPAPIVRKHTTAPVRRSAPRAKKKNAPDEHKRTTPVAFTKQSVGELKKVVWPSGEQVRQYFIVVLIFVLLIMTIVAGLDYGFAKLLLKLFG